MPESFSCSASRQIDCHPLGLFGIWTKAEVFLQVGEPKPSAAIFDAVKDGLFYWTIEWQGATHVHYGRYLHVESPHLLKLTWMSEGTKGKETLLTLEFKPEKGGTFLTVTHEGFGEQATARQHEQGWKENLEHVSAFCERG
jgi:uncharacterized protein YndB with AHSA1/START domain